MKRGSFIILILGAGVLTYQLFWPGSKAATVQIDVLQGSTAHKIADELIEKNILRSKIPFLIWTRLRHADDRMKVGRYLFPKGRAAFWIVDDLVDGRTQKVRMVIPEGFASWQIAERLEELKICSSEEFKKIIAQRVLEGFLYPSTYELDIGLTAETVARVFKNKFDQIWTEDMTARAAALGMSKAQVVTLASIVEREVVVAEERAMVAAVYHNRLKKKMLLQADPTVQYALGFWKQRLLYDDLRNTTSPYNTYLVAGLPPGPICSPSVASIQAVLWPATTDALYFVAKGDGTHTFSVSYREHTNKVNKRNSDRKKRKK